MIKNLYRFLLQIYVQGICSVYAGGAHSYNGNCLPACEFGRPSRRNAFIQTGRKLDLVVGLKEASLTVGAVSFPAWQARSVLFTLQAVNLNLALQHPFLALKIGVAYFLNLPKIHVGVPAVIETLNNGHYRGGNITYQQTAYPWSQTRRNS